MKLADLKAGAEFGPSAWREVGQDRINVFADATDDHQWIHVDPQRAAAGPFGSTIAHGYLTLSLLGGIGLELLEVEDVRTAINYGLNKVRFPAPVPVGSRLRASFRVEDVTELEGGAAQVTALATIERENGDKPVCVAEVVFRFYPNRGPL